MTALAEITIPAGQGPQNPFTGAWPANAQDVINNILAVEAITSALFSSIVAGRLLKYAAFSGDDSAGYSWDPTERWMSLDDVRSLYVWTSAGGQKWLIAESTAGTITWMGSPSAAQQTQTGAQAWFDSLAPALTGGVKSRWVRCCQLAGSDGAWVKGGLRLANLKLIARAAIAHSAGGQYWLSLSYPAGAGLTIVGDDASEQDGSEPIAWARGILANLQPI